MKTPDNRLITKRLTFLAFILTTIFSSQSHALGKLGHKLVCQLTFEHLSQANQNKISDLISTMPKQHQQIVNKYNHRKLDSTISFAEACTWADAIKKRPNYKKFKAWHYLNVSRDTLFIKPDACRQNCLTKAITYHQQQLVTSNSPWSKLQALMFLGHWLGDIHQPLHVSFASDRGGNKNKVRTNKKQCDNLHWLWDECLLFQGNNNMTKAQIFGALHKKLTKQWQSLDISSWQQSSIEKWATESLSLARSPELLYCHVNSEKRCISHSDRTIKLPKTYYKKHVIILEERILKAAVRLNYLLEKSLL